MYATLNAPIGEWIKDQLFQDGGSYMVPPSARVILNPGSVGQPRDGNPRASYAIYDSVRAQFEVFRVAYDIGRAQEASLEAGLPQVLAARLASREVGRGLWRGKSTKGRRSRADSSGHRPDDGAGRLLHGPVLEQTGPLGAMPCC